MQFVFDKETSTQLTSKFMWAFELKQGPRIAILRAWNKIIFTFFQPLLKFQMYAFPRVLFPKSLAQFQTIQSYISLLKKQNLVYKLSSCFNTSKPVFFSLFQHIFFLSKTSIFSIQTPTTHYCLLYQTVNLFRGVHCI